MTIKLNTKIKLDDISLFIYLLYAFFGDLINTAVSSLFRTALWCAVLALMLVQVILTGDFKRNRNFLTGFVLVLFLVLFRNHDFTNGSVMNTVRWLYSYAFIFLAYDRIRVYERGMKYLVAIGYVHVAATYLFWLVPSLYTVMPHIWGYIPSGTGNGKFGYRAGICNHYSANGIMLAIVLLGCFALIMQMNDCKDKGKKYRRERLVYIILAAFTLFAIVLTTKRAHLLFSVAAMICVYYFCRPNVMNKKTFRLITAGLVGAVGLFAAYLYVPAVSDMMSRFTTVEEDSTMQSRFVLWELAIEMFAEKPIFGWGWRAYPYRYRDVLFAASGRADRYSVMPAHNVYIQLLSEVGVIGLAVYLAICVWLLRITFTMLRRKSEMLQRSGLVAPIYFSAAMQVFILMYNMTGNCLYDLTFYFYALSILFAAGGHYYCKKAECTEAVRAGSVNGAAAAKRVDAQGGLAT